MLSWIVASNYHSALLLRRLCEAGVALDRGDGKSMDGWVVEQVRMGNLASAARQRLDDGPG